MPEAFGATTKKGDEATAPTATESVMVLVVSAPPRDVLRRKVSVVAEVSFTVMLRAIGEGEVPFCPKVTTRPLVPLCVPPGRSMGTVGKSTCRRQTEVVVVVHEPENKVPAGQLLGQGEQTASLVAVQLAEMYSPDLQLVVQG